MSLTFYTNPNSRGRIVRWMLEEVGCDYETVVLPYQQTSENDPWGGAALERLGDGDSREADFFTRVNPIGKVPAIEHDGQIITEAAAICAYLAETFAEAGLAPKPDERAAYYRALFFAAGPLEQAVTNFRAGFQPTPEQEFFLGYGSYDRTIDHLERLVTASPFVAGDRFTAADVYFGSHIGWGLGLQTLPPRQTFLDYAGKLVEREAYMRGVAKDAALMTGA